ARFLTGAVISLLVAAILWPNLSTDRARAAFSPAHALPGLGNGHIWSLAVSPSDPNFCLAGTDNGIYTSHDGGQTWMGTSLNGVRVWSVGFDVRPGNPIFAGLSSGGVRRSDDNAKTWTNASAGLGSKDIRSLAFG